MLRKTRDLLNLFSMFDFNGMMISSVATSTQMDLDDFTSCILLMAYYAHISQSMVMVAVEMLARYPNALKEEEFGFVTHKSNSVASALCVKVQEEIGLMTTEANLEQAVKVFKKKYFIV